MSDNRNRTGSVPAVHAPQHRSGRFGRLLRRVVHATLDKLSSPSRDLSPEYFRFPLF